MNFLRYVSTKAKQMAEADAYRNYLCDCLFFLGRNESPSVKFRDLMHPKPEEKRSAGEIIDNIKTGLERLVNK